MSCVSRTGPVTTLLWMQQCSDLHSAILLEVNARVLTCCPNIYACASTALVQYVTFLLFGRCVAPILAWTQPILTQFPRDFPQILQANYRILRRLRHDPLQRMSRSLLLKKIIFHFAIASWPCLGIGKPHISSEVKQIMPRFCNKRRVTSIPPLRLCGSMG
jgi:hypothetical protein